MQTSTGVVDSETFLALGMDCRLLVSDTDIGALGTLFLPGMVCSKQTAVALVLFFFLTVLVFG